MPSLSRLHLNGLRAVEAVARLGSLSAAAVELGVTPGAVSQQVLRTEAGVGRPLFSRAGGVLQPVATESTFFAQLHESFRLLDGAVGSLFTQSRRRLTVSVAPVFAAKWLVPRLGAFQRLHPEIQILIDATITLVDLDRNDVDVAIRVGAGPWAGIRAEPLIEQEAFPVCSPEIAARLSTPADLADVPVIRDANTALDWPIWLAGVAAPDLALGQGPTYSDASLCLDAAIAGQGVFLGWRLLAEDALKAGRLIRPFDHVALTGKHYWLITSNTRQTDMKARLFGEWLKAEMRVLAQSQNWDDP
jgi:DNA-binding transcriptional LysR family regulator